LSNFLSADIGGTKTLLRLATQDGAVQLQNSYSSHTCHGFAEMLDDFLREAGNPSIVSACLALAGPVHGRKVKLTNLPWEVDADAIAMRFAIPEVRLINDFEAVGHGIAALREEDLLTLQAGEPVARGARVVTGAGTGLGVAWLTPAHGRYVVHPSEGGHMDFAPADAMQYELLCYLQRRYGHVSYERIVSGPGLVAIFEFLRDSNHATPSARLSAAMEEEGDTAAIVAQFAMQEDEPIARQALELFVSIYGAFVGNLALLMLPRGGIYLAGGIAAKILPFMQGGLFMRAFLDKGRYTALLKTLPLHIVTNPQVGLLGAQSLCAK
jgi:glucokinase